jgi:hypothetical protein
MTDDCDDAARRDALFQAGSHRIDPLCQFGIADGLPECLDGYAIGVPLTASAYQLVHRGQWR